jgi:curved DNA-binding protein CbpA
VLQLSPNADQDTVHRVYRLLAQRYHPDNAETGDTETFRRLTEAYRVLGDPERRAGYDADHQLMRRLRWKIFDQPKAAQGVEAEKRKRQGILGLLYSKRCNEPAQPAMSLFDLEDLLGVPREHLEFALWYLKEQTLITRTDNARYAITVRGVEEFEKAGVMPLREDHLLPEPSPQPGTAAA